MKLDMIKDERLKTLRDMVGHRQSRLKLGEGNAYFQKEEVRALDWAITLIRHAAERGILDELEREDAS